MKLIGICQIHRGKLLENDTIALNASFSVGESDGKKVYENISLYCSPKANKATRSFAESCLAKIEHNSVVVHIEAIDNGSTAEDDYVNRSAQLLYGHCVASSAE